MPLPSHATDRSRFQASRLTLLIDRLMTVLIRLGGVLVVTSVLGIFIFIFLQIWPLFGSAKVAESMEFQLPQDARFDILGMDEWGSMPFLLDSEGRMSVVDTRNGSVDAVAVRWNRKPEGSITASSLNKREGKMVLGTSQGEFLFLSPNYSSRPAKDGERDITLAPEASEPLPIGTPGLPVVDIAYGDSGTQKLVCALQAGEEGNTVTAQLFKRKRSLLGAGKEVLADTFDLTPLLPDRPTRVFVPATGDSITVLTAGGRVILLALRDTGRFEMLQNFQPFGDKRDPHVNAANFIFGDVSLAVASDAGANRVFSLYYPPGGGDRIYGLTHDFPPLGASPVFLVSTLRNKAFLLGGGDRISLRYSTTDTVRWTAQVPFQASKAVINAKYNRIAILDNVNRLHLFDLDDPHPDSGWKALFGKVWYEGSPEPKWEWQSTGGSDDFEPKYSLVPLIFGTLKGTFYAMILSVPIALLAALYTSQFLEPGIRRAIKPTMEIMASLPSVVLGFLAAIYIAPLIERQIPSLLLVAAGIPVLATLTGAVWSRLPIRYRKFIRPGWEWLVFLPMLAVAGWVLWGLGPAFESLAFVVVDPSTGAAKADFRAWWPAVTGTAYDQRNSLVVGFMMGFAVIPIIFTIAEDSLSNVPKSLVTASMACGASRWQTALRVVLPTASAGIFSALMIGLGRAVGETMIVVMATGNTPIMEWNIFSGMRTLSANIAVELPEAPHHSTLYRTLFLGALVLFIITFTINTVAELLRHHLRNKYKTI
jgi:phosphate transport system permease protein